MPSNEKLIESITEIDENFKHEGQSNADMVATLKELRLKQSILELDENADFEGKDLDALTAMFEELKPDAAEEEKVKKEKAEAAKIAKAEAAKKAKEEKAAEAEAAKKPPYEIAEGKSITTKRGILAEGDEIKAKDLPGGKEALDSFVNSGHVVKN